MARPNLVDSLKYYTVPYVLEQLGLSRCQLTLRIARGILAQPTHVQTGVRYFSWAWIKEAKRILRK